MSTTIVASVNGELTQEQKDAMQDLMDSQAEHHNSETDKLVASLGVSEHCASDVVYLRTRFRHTQELEDNLIALHQVGTPPNIFEYGCTKETGEALMKAADNALKVRSESLIS